MDAARQAARETVRALDRDRYIAALYAPESARDALFALFAFDAEVAAIRDRVSEPLPGEIRLQWWRDVLEGRAEGAGSPLAAALLDTIRRHDLPVATFSNLLEARDFDLYDDPMPSRTDLEGYCGETASAMIQLSAMILDPTAASGAQEAAGHAGCAVAIAGMAARMPRDRARGRCFVPVDMLAAVGSEPGDFLRGPWGDAQHRAAAAMAALAGEHLAGFEAQAARLPSSLRPAFLPAALVPLYLEKMLRPGFGETRQAVVSDLRRQWVLFRHARRGWR